MGNIANNFWNVNVFHRIKIFIGIHRNLNGLLAYAEKHVTKCIVKERRREEILVLFFSTQSLFPHCSTVFSPLA